MEYGNIGNYYIIEPFVRELHRVFPGVEIRTTLQMTRDFCDRENVVVLPMDLYFAWEDDDLDRCLIEYGAAEIYDRTGYLPKKTPYIEEVLAADLVIDFSGDIWGENADFLGPDRFLIGAYKNLTAHLLRTPSVMLAGSPGPFSDEQRPVAHEVFAAFDAVTNREPVSTQLLASDGFDVTHVKDTACPSFLFEPASPDAVRPILQGEGLQDPTRPKVGFILCGWNFEQGPYGRWPRDDSEYTVFAETVEYLANRVGADVWLLSHSNGFELPPNFQLIHGRDYPVIKQLQDVVMRRGKIYGEGRVRAFDDIYSPAQTKAIIGQFDMLVSGRVHGAVGGLSQCVPTVIIDYGHEPKAHKLKGFAKVAQVEEYVADPSDADSMIAAVATCWSRRKEIREHLQRRIPEVQQLAHRNFDILPEIATRKKTRKNV